MMISRNAHLKVAAALWGLVGLGLLMAGLFFLFGNRSLEPSGEPGKAPLIAFVVALGIGFIKGWFVLRRVSQKNKARIFALPEKSPLHMTFSRKSWMLVLCMILLGRLIRMAGAPFFIVGGIYVAVGVALLLGSRFYLASSAKSMGDFGVGSMGN